MGYGRIQFSFWKRGFTKQGKTQALVMAGHKKFIVDEVRCRVPSKTVTRRRNPVFVVEAYGHLYIGEKRGKQVAVIYAK